MSNVLPNPPVRIYVLWHPGFDSREELGSRDPKSLSEAEKARLERGLKLARRIYYWFRLENMEGIPVYFRSTAEKPGESEAPLDIPDDEGVRNYVIPLVDAHMVASPDWRAYVAGYVAKDASIKCRVSTEAPPTKGEYRLLPVAMESVAYNMPESMRNLNFIRHIIPEASTAKDGELIARLTEVICRDLRDWLFKKTSHPASKEATTPEKIKIFLSHAKADDTHEAISLKQYIQGETQCEAFFDETDLASGHDFVGSLRDAVSMESAGLIVIQGDNYADRPWCRKEIRDFLKPIHDPLARKTGHRQFFVPPAVVVQTMKGRQLARTIPELGYSPCVRWQADSARFVVTTLLREILFGLFYRALARRVAEQKNASDAVYINRSPDPVMITRIMAAEAGSKRRGSKPPHTFIDPGYGLSSMEKGGLLASFPGYTFRSFSENPEVDSVKDRYLAGSIIAISAGNAGDPLPGIGSRFAEKVCCEQMFYYVTL